MELIDKEFINNGGLFEFMNELGTIQCKDQKRYSELVEEEMEYNNKHGVERAEFDAFCRKYWTK